MPATQQRFWPDAQPLVERLGKDFFRGLPECAGVYLMRGEDEPVLYVGKAKNLRKRLNSYRVANPDRMPRRILRLLRTVTRIEWQPCLDEAAALARESELLRALKPRFNRAGTWPGPARYFAWRWNENGLELGVLPAMEPGWSAYGPMGRGAVVLRAVLARLLWLAFNPQLGFSGLPIGWSQGMLENPVCIRPSPGLAGSDLTARIEFLMAGESEHFCQWVREQMYSERLPFEMAALEADLEFLSDLSAVKGPKKS